MWLEKGTEDDTKFFFWFLNIGGMAMPLPEVRDEGGEGGWVGGT